MVAVKDLTTSAQKFARNAGNSAGEYATRSAEAGTRWQNNSTQAQQTYHQAITAPGISQRFARGIQRAGATKYTGRIESVAQNRYAEGVGVAQGDWQSGFQPYAQALTSLTLDQRRPRGDRANYRRVEQVGTRLNAVRLSQLGGASS